MRVLIVTQYFWPETFRVNDLALALRDRGHAVTVLTGIPNYPSGRTPEGYRWWRRYREQWQGIDVVRAPLLPRGNGSGVRLMLNYLWFVLSASIVGWSTFRRHQFDVIFVHEPSPVTVGIPAIAMKWRQRVPILFWVLDLWPESVSAAGGVKSPLVLKTLAALTRWIYRRCDRLLVQSRAFYAPIEQLDVAPGKIMYFPNWAEDVYRPEKRDESVNLTLPDGFCVMFAGNLGAAQDLPAVIDAAARLKHRADIHWLIVGDGRMLDWTRTEVERRDLTRNVHFLGRHPMERMPALFAHADALLVSLKPDPIFALTVPAKLQSYLACGRPILGMLNGEGARLIDEAGAGLACAAGDSAALARLVTQLADMTPDARENMGVLGRDYYLTHFDREKLFDQLERWMAEARVAYEPRTADDGVGR